MSNSGKSLKLTLLMFFMGLFFLMIPSAGATLAWVENGWSALDQSRDKQAIAIWQTGVNALHDNDLLYVLGVFRNIDSAINVARKVALPDHLDIILLERPFKGKRAYFVLNINILSDDGSMSQKDLADMQETIGSKEHLHAEPALKYKAEVPAEWARSQPDSLAQAAEKSGVTVSEYQMDVQMADESHLSAVKEAVRPDVLQAGILQSNAHAGWMLSGRKSLKENIEPLLKTHGWKLAWEIEHDFRVGMDARLSGGVFGILEQIVDAYFKRGIFLKLTWFDGNRVLLIQQVFAEHEMQEVAKP